MAIKFEAKLKNLKLIFKLLFSVVMGQVLKDQAQGNPELWKPRTFNEVCLLHKIFSDSKISNSRKIYILETAFVME